MLPKGAWLLLLNLSRDGWAGWQGISISWLNTARCTVPRSTWGRCYWSLHVRNPVPTSVISSAQGCWQRCGRFCVEAPCAWPKCCRSSGARCGGLPDTEFGDVSVRGHFGASDSLYSRSASFLRFCPSDGADPAGPDWRSAALPACPAVSRVYARDPDS